ncbi:MAG: sigma-54 dependent transcriptional regulator [Planctomycetia bacterium]|nr:sigma-54 dependent transcriptional regulator [Planctomycetia bacterium]
MSMTYYTETTSNTAESVLAGNNICSTFQGNTTNIHSSTDKETLAIQTELADASALKNNDLRSNSPPEQILLISNEPSSRIAMRHLFEMENIQTVESEGNETSLKRISSDVCVILIDSVLEDGSSEVLCQQIVERFPDIPVIYMDEPSTDPSRRKRIGKMVHTCIIKPCERLHLLQSVRQAMKLSRYIRENRCLRQTIGIPVFPVSMVGVSAVIQTLRKQIEAFGRLDNTILITGEHGTGKSTIAQQIHQAGPRARFPFLSFSCNSLPPDVLEADLFGANRGSIPGINMDRPGRIELAHRGTLYLDHIEALTPSMQKRLFHYLQDKKTWRVGSTEPRTIDTRIIASTSCDLAIACVQGRFRDELYFRLNALTLNAPSLRDRIEDIPSLSREIMGRIARYTDRNLSILSTAAMNKLRQYSWPFNIKELESVLQKAMENASDTVISENDISFDTMVQDAGSHDGAMGLAGLTMAEIERRAIIETINACGGNRAQSARKLGVSEKTIYNKIKQFKLRGIV